MPPAPDQGEGSGVITRWTPERVVAPIEAAFKPAAEGLEKVAKSLAPVRTGRLAASTHITYTGGTTGVLRADVPYAAPVMKGTRAHEIDAGGAPMPIGGGKFATVVHHPATAAHPYLQEAAPSFRPLFVNAARGLMHLGF